MDSIAFVTMLAVLEYLVFGLLTGRARVTYQVPAPATTGHPIFERYYRVQQNTLEQLAVFLPSLWIFARYIGTSPAAMLGFVFVIGRALYFRGYIQDPANRSTGFLVGFVATAILLLGALLSTFWAVI